VVTAPADSGPLVTVLAGGVGAARFLQGLVQVVAPEQVVAIVNTGDDAEFYGVHVSPDLDIVMYTLAGLVDEERGWGIRGDTFVTLDQLQRFGVETWFRLGDRDLAACLERTRLLRAGARLSAVTERLCQGLGVQVHVLPMSDDSVRTFIRTPAGDFPFQEYFVKRGQRDVVRGVDVRGAAEASPAPGVVDAIRSATTVIIAPSNPFVSIGTILAIPGVRDELARRRERVVAVTPIIGGAAIKGPAAAMLAGMGAEVSALGVAALYRDVAGTFVLDSTDAHLASRVEALRMRAVVAPTLMTGPEEKRALADRVLHAVDCDSCGR